LDLGRSDRELPGFRPAECHWYRCPVEEDLNSAIGREPENSFVNQCPAQIGEIASLRSHRFNWFSSEAGHLVWHGSRVVITQFDESPVFVEAIDNHSMPAPVLLRSEEHTSELQ